MPHLLQRIAETLQMGRRFTRARWRYLFYTLKDAEKRRIGVFLSAAALIAFGAAAHEYWVVRDLAPHQGGDYTEGIMGQPRFLNPVLASTNEADRDMVTLLFTGLTTHNSNGEIVPELAESMEVKENGRVYEFILLEGLRWPDGTPLTANDVVFTIERIRDPAFESPLRALWQGVQVEKVDERTVRFNLNVPYGPFLENTTLGILPKHFWEGVPATNFALAELNIKPMGAGPYTVRRLKKDASGAVTSLELERNPYYHREVFIDRITIRFYANEDELLSAFRQGAVDGLSLFSPKAKDEVGGAVHFHKLEMARYFAVFLNSQKNGIFESLEVRQALSHAVPREGIVEEVLQGEGTSQEGPLPPWLLTSDADYTHYSYDPERAREILEAAGWKDENGDGIREKELEDDTEPQKLEFTLTTSDFPELTQVASILIEEWRDIGAEVHLDISPIATIQQEHIRPRAYQSLLFGEVLGLDVDAYAFWHSSQTQDPGLNLSLYKESRVDEILETARQVTDRAERLTRYGELQQIITRDAPAIFLYSPHYLYVLPRKIKGFEKMQVANPSQRFENVESWYIETQRIRSDS